MSRPRSRLKMLGSLENHDGNTEMQLKGLISRTMTLHVHRISWYISLPSPSKQERETSKFYVVQRT